MPIVKCDYCGKEINKTSGQIKKYNHHFCSNSHSAAFIKVPKILVVCDMCGIEFEKSLLAIKTQIIIFVLDIVVMNGKKFLEMFQINLKAMLIKKQSVMLI